MDFNKLCTHCMTEVQAAAGQPCPKCGHKFHEGAAAPHLLAPFSILQGKYLVGDMLGEGGFGITYIGMDINLEMKVAIKEFYPNGYCNREAKTTTMVNLFQGPSLEAVKKWRDNFLQEAKSLAKLSHLPGVVGVKDFFYENNTAYIILEYLEGQDLKHYVKSFGGKLPAATLLPALEPVITSMAEVHQTGIIHRDISPDNIMLLPGGKMKLLDFGAARSFLGSGERSLSVMLKPGYAPEEQYRSKGKQGPWSDVYAMAGTIYKCLTGVTPPESMERLHKDELIPPTQLGAELTPQQEAALLKALSVHAEDRYQSMEEFHAGLYRGNPVPDISKKVDNETVVDRDIEEISPPKNDKKAFAIIAGSVVGGALVLLGLVLAVSFFTGKSKKDLKTSDLEEMDIAVEVSETSEEMDLPENASEAEDIKDNEDYMMLYNDYIENHKGAAATFAYIDDDDIPECIVWNKGFVQLLTIKDGAVAEERKSSEFEGGTGREDILCFNEYSGKYAIMIFREDAGALEEIHIYKMGEEDEYGNAYYVGLTEGDPQNDPFGAYTQFYADGEPTNMYDYARYLEVYMDGMVWYDTERYCENVFEAMEIYNNEPNGDYYVEMNQRLPYTDSFTVLDDDLEPMTDDELIQAMLEISNYDENLYDMDNNGFLEYIANWTREEQDPGEWFDYLLDVEKENLRRIARYRMIGEISYVG